MIIIRKNFSDPIPQQEQEKSSGLGGTLLKAGATLGVLYGAKKGMLGNTIRTGMNKGIMYAGKAVGSKGIIESGAKDYAKGRVSQINNVLSSSQNPMSMTKNRQKDLVDKISNNWVNKMTKDFKTE